MTEYLSALADYARFSGRARRRAFWMFWLVHAAVFASLVGLDAALLGRALASPGFGSAYLLAAALPALALTVRRLHDTGRGGWWVLTALVPGVGALLLLFWAAQPGLVDGNRYGRDPRSSCAPF